MFAATGDFWPKLRQLFSIDVRSLAAFRVGLGALVTLDLVARWPLIEVLYTDEGLVPRELLKSSLVDSLDLYRMSGSYAWAAGCMALTLSCSLLFTVGCRTRSATVVLWLLMSALLRRNPLATDGGDSLVRCFLFWSMFLPLGGCWSVDARFRERPPSPVYSAASAALLLQPALLYLVTGVLKNTTPWRAGYAVFLALQQTEWVRPLGVWLSQQAHLVEWLTFATRVVEIGAPVLLFLPVFTARARALGVALLVALQIGLATSLRLNFFPFYSSVAWLAFVPSTWWDRFLVSRVPMLGRSLPSTPRHPWPRYWLLVREAIVLVALLLGTVVGLARTEARGLIAHATMTLGFAQRWYMYRDFDNDYSRVRTVATLANGTSVDLRTDQGHLLDSPLEDWARSYRADIILDALTLGNQAFSRAFARVVCRRWNAGTARGSALTSLTLTTRVVWQYRPRPTFESVLHEPCVTRR